MTNHRHRHHRGLAQRAATEHRRRLRRQRLDAILRDTFLAGIADAIYTESALLVALGFRQPSTHHSPRPFR